jgi:hypothetical protein
MDSGSDLTDRSAGFVQCHVCDAVVDLVWEDLRAIVPAGWPTCCGYVMMPYLRGRQRPPGEADGRARRTVPRPAAASSPTWDQLLGGKG